MTNTDLTGFDLTVFGTQVLEAELKRRKDEALHLENEKREAQRKVWLENVDAFLALYPTHYGPTCSDDEPFNEKRCNRCTLLTAKNEGWWPEELEVKLILRVRE